MKSKNSLMNFLSSYFIYFVLVLLGILKVKFFLNHLGQDLYALNQLYVNLYSYLAIAEGGISMALIYRLYPRFAEKKYDAINELYSGTKIIYRRIGFIVIGAGFGLTFLIPHLLKDSTISAAYIMLTFMLFVIRSSLDYFAIVPRLIIQADQKMYKVNLLIFGSRFFIILAEILIIIAGYDYVYSLIPGIILTLIANIIINRFVYKTYPWLKTVAKKDYSTYADTKHLLLHKSLQLVTKNIDIVLITFYLGSLSVTIYAAYNYFVKFALDSFEHIFNAVKDSMGLIFQENTGEEIAEKVREYFSIFDFIAVVAISVFYLNINKFIILWIGKSYVTDAITLFLFLFLVYTSTLRQSYELTKTAMGRFKETKLIATIQAALNVLFSLIFVNTIGMKGVILGTIVSFVLTDFWYYPHYIIKTVCKRSLLSYYWTQLINLIVFGTVLFGSDFLLRLVFGSGIGMSFILWMGYALSSLVLVLLMSVPLSLAVSPPFRRIALKALNALNSIRKRTDGGIIG